MQEAIEKIEAAPTLTPHQRATLLKKGPFRIYAVNPEAKLLADRLVLLDPKKQGVLAQVASDLSLLKAAKGGEYVIEDPRTTRLLWSTINVKPAVTN